MLDIFILDAQDNVGVAVRDLPKDVRACCEAGEITLAEAIPRGHKAALRPIARGETAIKYAHPIGTATQDIAPGQWVHTHNLATNLTGLIPYRYSPVSIASAVPGSAARFMGYLRADGEAGIRNELWVIPTVGCVNATARQLAEKANAKHGGRGVDGIYALTHPYGCSQLGEDHRSTQRILADLTRHPNAGGVLVLGLGCENNHIAEFQQALGAWDGRRVKFLAAQDVLDETEAGLRLLDELAEGASQCRRESLPASMLKIGMKCGGSDGFSGITANPLAGAVADMLAAQGACVALTETPEMFGAEQILMDRARDTAVFEDIVGMINRFKEYFIRHGQAVYDNPSPGNKDGGITTLEEKSLGCIRKGGGGAVTGVLPYGGRITGAGLNLLEGPGNDPVSITALAAAGCQMILFTTGRGTPLGACVPTVKIASSSELSSRKPAWIDFSAGAALEGLGMQELAGSLFDYMLAVASGEMTRNERNGIREIAIFKDGVTL